MPIYSVYRVDNGLPPSLVEIINYLQPVTPLLQPIVQHSIFTIPKHQILISNFLEVKQFVGCMLLTFRFASGPPFIWRQAQDVDEIARQVDATAISFLTLPKENQFPPVFILEAIENKPPSKIYYYLANPLQSVKPEELNDTLKAIINNVTNSNLFSPASLIELLQAIQLLIQTGQLTSIAPVLLFNREWYRKFLAWKLSALQPIAAPAVSPPSPITYAAYHLVRHLHVDLVNIINTLQINPGINLGLIGYPREIASFVGFMLQNFNLRSDPVEGLSGNTIADTTQKVHARAMTVLVALPAIRTTFIIIGLKQNVICELYLFQPALFGKQRELMKLREPSKDDFASIIADIYYAHLYTIESFKNFRGALIACLRAQPHSPQQVNCIACLEQIKLP